MPNRYPQEAVTRDGRRLLIRPMTAADGDALFDFFQRLPEETRRFAWDRIEDRATTDRWCRDLDYSKMLPLLALDRSLVVAAVSLHHREKGPLRLVGRISWLLEAHFRGVGLGALLINHFIGIARRRGLRYLSCMLISDLEAEAIQVLSDFGFKSYSFPNYGVDPDGDPHDMTKMILEL
jgi:GNAT superfamily N-acetyltransferase